MFENRAICGIIHLGKRGENLARRIVFDECRIWESEFGKGKYYLFHQRNGDAAPYPVALKVEDGSIYWEVSSLDTSMEGEGKCELRYVVGDVVVKSHTWKTVVSEGLDNSSTEPPEPAKAWVDEVIKAAEEAKGVYNISNGTGKNSVIQIGSDNEATGKFAVALGRDNASIGVEAYTTGYGNEASGTTSIAQGSGTKARGAGASTKGILTEADGHSADAKGYKTKAKGKRSSAKGTETIADGENSSSKGYKTKALGFNSSTKGSLTEAEGDNSDAKGYATRAKGKQSSTKGFATTAEGENSSAEGRNTKALSDNQHVQGKFNIPDKNNEYADIVGNGKSVDNRSNAYTLDWQGNARFMGSAYVGGTQKGDPNLKKLATEDYTYSKEYSDERFAEVTKSFTEVNERLTESNERTNDVDKKFNLASNNLKGTATGSKELTIEDVSELPHEMKVKLLIHEAPDALGSYPVVLVHSGNLIGISKDKTRSNYTSTNRLEILDKDNSIRVNIINSAYARILFGYNSDLVNILNKCIGMKFTFSIKEAHSQRIDIAYTDVNGAHTIYGEKGSNSITFSLPNKIYEFQIRPYAMSTGTETETIIEDMRLTISDDIRPYTPYISNAIYETNYIDYNPDEEEFITTATINVKSIYPKLVLSAFELNNTPIDIEVDYNKDIAKAFEEIVKRLVAVENILINKT